MKVFTNGCFDVLHPGHIDLLARAKALGSKLIVGINSDESVRKIKGAGRPVFNQDERSAMLLALESVDEVVIFDELTPEKLIKEIKPDILVKGGDWTTDEIIGADFVTAKGGKVYSLPQLEGYSSSGIIEAWSEPPPSGGGQFVGGETGPPLTQGVLTQHLDVIQLLLNESVDSIEECGKLIIETFKNGGKVLLCGNGGSAADAQHIAAEFVGRYENERRALPAIALTTDTSALTALANDYDFERIYSRQVEALAEEGDCLIAISTSGGSPNIIAAVMAARKKGTKVIGMTGAKGKKLASLCDACILVPSDRTARIQEAHITVGHIWCEMVEMALSEPPA